MHLHSSLTKLLLTTSVSAETDMSFLLMPIASCMYLYYGTCIILSQKKVLIHCVIFLFPLLKYNVFGVLHALFTLIF